MKVGMDHLDGSIISDNDFISRDLCNRKEKDKIYSVVTDETYGRHMVAARNIKAGEIILEDVPVTMGPACSSGIVPLCLSCYKRVNGDYLCSKCCWPMCSAECENNPEHANQECKLFQGHPIKVDAGEFNYRDEEPMYSVISPIRAILLKAANPERWSMIWNLMSHNENRRKEDYWKEKQAAVVKNIRERLGLVDISEELIDTVLGIFLVNDFEINNTVVEEEFAKAEKSSLRGLYSIASIPNHSCVCNTTHSFQQNNNYRMIVRASRDIKKNEDITHTYVDPLEPLLVRQELLNLGKFFHCQCERCSDATELDTYCSAMVCPSCKKGYMLSADVSSNKSDWSCNLCQSYMSADKISRVSSAVKAKSNELEYDASKPEQCGIPAHQDFLKKYGRVLHSNHVVMTAVKYSLAKMYGRMEGYTADQLTDEQFKYKQKLCEEVLGVFDKILPGTNRMRGVMLYELHLPFIMLANRQLQRGPGSGADPKAIKSGLKKGLECLKKGLEILKLEPEGSFESKIVAGSKDSVKELENFYDAISKAI